MPQPIISPSQLPQYVQQYQPMQYQPAPPAAQQAPVAQAATPPTYLAPTQTVVKYAQPEAAQQYAMRPPAPYIDTSVPQPQQQIIQQEIRRTPKLQPKLEYVPPPPPPQPVVQAPPPAPEAPKPAEKILGGDITGSFGLTTDYTFRGISQTKKNPAVQGGVEYQHEVGAYIGLWASNVNFNDGGQAQIEMDGYGGYRTALTDSLNADIGAIYYAYPGANSNLNYDYWEFYASTEYAIPVHASLGSGFDVDKATVGASFSYSPEFFANSGTGYYLKAKAAMPFANGITLDGHLGKQWVQNNQAFGLPDYMDWSLGVAYALPKEFSAKLEYIDTNIDKKDCPNICSAKAVASVSKSF